MVAIVDLLRRWQSKQWSAQRLQQYLLPWLLVAPYGTLLIAWLLQRKCLLWSTPPGTKSDTTTHTPDSSSLPDWCFSASFLIPEQDNCWDYFYCHPGWPAVWTRVAGVLHRHYFAYPKPAPAWRAGFDEEPAPPHKQRLRNSARHVVLHIRLHDSKQKLPSGYYVRAIAWVAAHLSPKPTLYRIQTDGRADEIEPIIKLIMKVGRGAIMPSEVAVDYNNGSLVLAFHRMVAADVLIMSRSSLSMAAGLLSNATTVLFPSCFSDTRLPLPHWHLIRC